MKHKPNPIITPDRSLNCNAEGCGSDRAHWGFHGRMYCADHLHLGEALMNATQDSVGGPAIASIAAGQQGRLI